MRTQGTYYIRGTEGRKDGRTDGRTEGRNAENYVPPLFFEKAGDKNKVYPCKLHFSLYKVGFTGVFVVWVCFLDVTKRLDLGKLDDKLRLL